MPAYHPRLPEGGRVQRASLLVWAVAPVALLAACGGGGSSGGVNSTPNPGGNPTPTPTPTATATPAAQFDTAEYRRSDGPEQHKAVSAWSKGYTGDDVSIAVIDSGIDVDNAEFAGRISPASKDIFDSRNQLDASDSHGTNVALVAAAARNSSGILGMAWGADVLADPRRYTGKLHDGRFRQRGRLLLRRQCHHQLDQPCRCQWRKGDQPFPRWRTRFPPAR